MTNMPTVTDLIGSLSERQRACLRLVGRGMTSKEIAIETGLMPQTVDTYIKTAMAKLNAPSRRDAARMLLAAESGLPQDLGSPSAAVVRSLSGPHFKGTAKRSKFLTSLGLPPVGGAYNELSATQHTYALLRIAGISVIVISALVLFLAGVMMTFR